MGEKKVTPTWDKDDPVKAGLKRSSFPSSIEGQCAWHRYAAAYHVQKRDALTARLHQDIEAKVAEAKRQRTALDLLES